MRKIYQLLRRWPAADEGYITLATYSAKQPPSQKMLDLLKQHEFYLTEIGVPTKIDDEEDWEDKLTAQVALG